MIACSNMDFGDSELASAQAKHSLLAILLLTGSLVFMCLRNVIVKYFFGRKEDNINVSAFTNLRSMVFEIFFFGCLVAEINDGFEFTWNEFWAATAGGVLTSIAVFLMTFVNVRGKGGPSDAIIETSVIYQTFMDAMLFGRYPNFMQFAGVAVGFAASLTIIYETIIKNQKS